MSNHENKGQPAKAQNQQQAKQTQVKVETVLDDNKKTDNVVSIAQASAQEKYGSNNVAEASEKIAQTISIASRLMNETLSISKIQVEACVEASGIAAECAQNISESIYESANAAISENVEHFKVLFNCRTASDLFALQKRLSQANMEIFFNNRTKISNMLFEMGAKSREPFADRLSDYSDRITKIFK